MWLYDALSLFRAPELHERLGPKETINRLPILQTNNLKGAYVYSDAYMDDDRLVIETLRSANNLGARCVNFVKALGVSYNNEGVINAITCKNLTTNEQFQIKTKHVVSSVGPWTDEVGHSFFNNWTDIMRPFKGVHLTFSKARIPLKQAIVMGAEERIVFGIPRHDMVIIGTTDTGYKGDIAKVKTDKQDVEYLLKVANQYFPGAKLTEGDIVASYSGVRPLIKDSSQSEGKISREHIIISDPRGVTFVAGGKYTTYRHMAKQTVDAALDQFNFEDTMSFKKSNTNQPLNNYVSESNFKLAEAKEAEWGQEFGIHRQVIHHFIERYGLEAYEIIQKHLPKVNSLNLADNELTWTIEAYHAIEASMCLNLVDFYLRRTPLFLSMKNHGSSFKQNILTVFKAELGWSEEESKKQWDAIQQHIYHEMGWQSNLPD